MRETNFIKQKKDKWIELERTIQRVNPDPDKLNDLFVQITDDLSYSRTFYPNRSVRVYLNGLAQQIFYSIYKNKKSSGGKIRSFWTYDLPMIMYQCRWELFLAILLFWIPFIIGCLSGTMGAEEEFARQLLGDDYIDITLANIQQGDPMAIYKDGSKFTMFLTIFLNNLLVCFRYFMFGVLFTIGSIVELVFFGLYVGAFQYFFYEQGELVPSVLGIWMHGSIEIPAAILAGTAGIVMGKGLVFPGTYSRLQAFLISARRGIKVMIGTIPLIFLAAFVESYITRLTEIPDMVRASYIALTFFVILGYFVIYPYFLGTKNFKKHIPRIGGVTLGLAAILFILLLIFNVSGYVYFTLIAIPALFYIATKGFALAGYFEERPQEEEEEKLLASANDEVRFDRIKSSGEIFKDSFVIYKKYLPQIIWTAFGTAALFLAGVMLLSQGKPTDLFEYPARFAGITDELLNDVARHGPIGGFIKFIFETLGDIFKAGSQFLDYSKGILSPYFVINNIIYTTITFVSLKGLKEAYSKTENDFETKNRWIDNVGGFFKIAFVVFLMNFQLLLGVTTGFFYFTFFITFPFCLLWVAVMILEETNPVLSFGRTFQLAFTRFGNGLMLYIIIGLISLMIWSLFFSPVMMFILENFGYNIATNQEGMDELIVITVTYIAQAMIAIIAPLAVIGFGLFYYSQVEIKDAKSLIRKIQLIGTRKRIRGLEREG